MAPPPRDVSLRGLPHETMSHRALLIVAVLAAGLLAALVWIRRAPEPSKPVPVVVAPTGTATPVAVAAAATASPRRSEVRTETSFEPVDESRITAQQAAAAAARYRKAARYPRTSRPLDDGLDPIAKSRIPKVDYDGDDEHPEPRLLAYPSITSFEAPGDVVIYAEVVERRAAPYRGEDGAGPERDRTQQLRASAREMRGVLQTMDGVVVAPLQFRDDGTHGDGQADDELFTATYTPDPDKPNEFRGQYQVLVQADPDNGPELNATTTFVYSVQVARLTGNYRDAVVDGNLQIDAEIEVEAAGRFRVESTLVRTVDATMLGYGYGEAVLEPGLHWIPITYYGLIFHDMKAEGPYSMFSTMLSTLDANGMQESDVVPNAHTTKPYKVSQFGSEPFNDPEYMEKAEHFDAVRRAKAGGQ